MCYIMHFQSLSETLNNPTSLCLPEIGFLVMLSDCFRRIICSEDCQQLCLWLPV